MIIIVTNRKNAGSFALIVQFNLLNIAFFRCSPKCIIPSVLIALVLAGAITAVLVVVLPAKSTSKTNPQTAVLRWNTTGITVAGGGGPPGNASNQLSEPCGIALDSSNALYIGDTGNNRVQKYLPGASSGITVAGQANSSAGSSLASLHMPLGVQVDENQQVYVSDRTNGRIVLWPRGSTSGTILKSGEAYLSLPQLYVKQLDRWLIIF